jgi:hypothetical protein
MVSDEYLKVDPPLDEGNNSIWSHDKNLRKLQKK